jgi:hypothetical protein
VKLRTEQERATLHASEFQEAAMAGRRQRTNPLDAALARLADLAGRGVSPSRIAREVETIVTDWRSDASTVEPAEVSERLTELREQLCTGAEAAAEQVSDIDRSDSVALRHANLVHAALVAAVRAVESALEPSAGMAGGEASEAPRPVLAPARPVTIDPLAERTPQGLDLSHPEELRQGAGRQHAPGASTEKTKHAREKRNTHADRKEITLLSLIR